MRHKKEFVEENNLEIKLKTYVRLLASQYPTISAPFNAKLYHWLCGGFDKILKKWNEETIKSKTHDLDDDNTKDNKRNIKWFKEDRKNNIFISKKDKIRTKEEL